LVWWHVAAFALFTFFLVPGENIKIIISNDNMQKDEVKCQ
jgi:hypothetical protein